MISRPVSTHSFGDERYNEIRNFATRRDVLGLWEATGISGKRRASRKMSNLESAELCQIFVRMRQLTIFFR